jgi:transketolase
VLSIITSGITLHYSLEAAEVLQNSHNIKIRVIDLFSIKPIDVETLRKAADIGSLLIVEDHYEHGGIYSAVLSALGGKVKEAQ